MAVLGHFAASQLHYYADVKTGKHLAHLHRRNVTERYTEQRVTLFVILWDVDGFPGIQILPTGRYIAIDPSH